jgi:hypothetical protein
MANHEARWTEAVTVYRLQELVAVESSRQVTRREVERQSRR